MGGANYMGGKRNAVRARTKDVTSRLQKDHFGKQRLNLLAYGVVRNSAQSLRQKPHTVSIDLAHARRDSMPRQLPTQRTHIPPPATSKNLESHNSALFAPSIPSHSRPSKLLTALEKFEPISFLSKKNRLLKISDFAGLISKPVETTLFVDKPTISRLPVSKRKLDGSDIFSRDIEKKRKLLPASDSTHGSSSSDLPPSPSPAFPLHLSVPRFNSSIHSFQTSTGSSEISSGGQICVESHPNSTYEDSIYSPQQQGWPEDEPTIPQRRYKLDQQFQDTECFRSQEHTRETSEISEFPTHPPSEYSPAELFEMSKEWCEMEVYLRVDDSQRQQTTALQRHTRALGRLGVDFYVFPHLKPLSIGKSFKSLTATDFPNDHSDLSFPALTPGLPVTPKTGGGGIPCSSIHHGAWEEQNSNDSLVDVLVPSSAASPLPNDMCFPSMELLEYDTPPESQQLPIHTGQSPQLLSDNVLGLSCVSAHTPPPSVNTNISNDKPDYTPGEPLHSIPTSRDRTNVHTVDPLIEDFSQSMNRYIQPSDSLSWGSPTESSNLTPHDPIPKHLCLAGDISVVRPLESPKNLQKSDVTTECKGEAGTYSQYVEASLIGLSSIDINIDFTATPTSVGPQDGTTATNGVQPSGFEDHTEPEVTYRGQQETSLEYYVRVDDAASEKLIEGPLLFASDEEEIDNED